jgi:hypothetical protein
VHPMDRRAFLVTGGLALAGLATACKKKTGALPAGGTMASLAASVKKTREEISVIQAVENLLVRPKSRVSFALVDKSGTKRLTGGRVQIYASAFDSKAAALGPVSAEYHGEGLGDKGIYVARIDIDHAANWNVLVVGRPDGATADVWGGAAYPAVQRVRGPAPGAKAISVATPTVDDHRGVEPYCTDTPPCSMHKISLDVALANGRPTIFVIGTPRFCQSKVCGPVVHVVQTVSAEFADRVNFVHAEVFKDDTNAPTDPVNGFAPAAKAWSLEEEPVTYWIKPDNTVTERIVGPTDIAEVRSLTRALVG